MTKRPPAVELACWLVWVLVAGGLLVCVMVVVQRDDLGTVWSPMQVGDSTVQPVEFVPVILVCYAVTAILAATLIALFRAGQNWARHSLVSIVLGIFLVAVGTVRTDPPTVVDAAAIAAGVLSAVTLVFLWHPQTSRFLRDAAFPPHDESPDGPASEEARSSIEGADAGQPGEDAVRADS